MPDRPVRKDFVTNSKWVATNPRRVTNTLNAYYHGGDVGYGGPNMGGPGGGPKYYNHGKGNVDDRACPQFTSPQEWDIYCSGGTDLSRGRCCGLSAMPTFSSNGRRGPGRSDRTLKENIDLVGKSSSGINIYEFEYKDKVHGEGRYQGVMAQEVPEASYNDNGYLWVDYSKIDVEFKKI